MKNIALKTLIENKMTVDELRIRSVDPSFYLLEVDLSGTLHRVVDHGGHVVKTRSVEAARRICEGMSVMHTSLVHQSAYDEMIGMPGKDQTGLEMKLKVANPETGPQDTGVFSVRTNEHLQIPGDNVATGVTNSSTWVSRLTKIGDQIDAGAYKAGPWQKLIGELRLAPATDKMAAAPMVSKVSNQLHARHGYLKAPFWAGYLFELTLFALALGLMATEPVYLRLLGMVCLAACLQPLIKVTTGLVVGVRYAHVYLWYAEPRFKMEYGRYLLLSKGQRVVLHLAGSLGTPIALGTGFFIFPDIIWLQWLTVAGCLGAIAMQIGAFIAVMLGVRKVGPFLLTTLTTPATLAEVLKSANSR